MQKEGTRVFCIFAFISADAAQDAEAYAAIEKPAVVKCCGFSHGSVEQYMAYECSIERDSIFVSHYMTHECKYFHLTDIACYSRSSFLWTE